MKFIAILALLGLAFAGCVGSSPPSSTAPISVSPGRFDEATGAIEGMVVDPELRVIEGAALGIRGSTATTTSGPDGRFSFSFVPPGRQIIEAQKLGYETTLTAAEVSAGAATENIRVNLAPLVVSQPRRAIFDFRGYVTCSIGNEELLSEECGQGLQTDFGTFARDANNKIDWRFNLTDLTGLKSVYIEMWWKPASAAADEMALNVAHGFQCNPSCTQKVRHCDAFRNYGKPTLKCELDEEALDAIKPSQLPYDLTARAWAAPAPVERTTVVYQQSFLMYRTEFFDEERPEGYTTVKDT